MNDQFYYYSLKPLDGKIPQRENISEIDLNVSNSFRIFFSVNKNEEDGSVRDNQMNRWNFISSHSEEMNIIAHLLKEIEKESRYSSYDIACKKIYDDIINGKYGKYPIEFFRNEDEKYQMAQEIILYYLIKKNHNDKRQDYFQYTLKNIFLNKVIFYFDKVKKILFISFIAEGTEENKLIYEVCRYFFADILINIEVRWRCYPVILDKTDYVIMAENKQLCGTII